MVSHNLQQQGAAEAGDVKFVVEQRMEAAVMLLQDVRNWHIDLDTAVAIPRDFCM